MHTKHNREHGQGDDCRAKAGDTTNGAREQGCGYDKQQFWCAEVGYQDEDRFLKSFEDEVGQVVRGRESSTTSRDISGSMACLNYSVHGCVDCVRLFHEAKRVLQHERGTENRANRVGFARSDDVWCCAVARFIEPPHFAWIALAVVPRQASQARGRQHAQRSSEHRRFV